MSTLRIILELRWSVRTPLPFKNNTKRTYHQKKKKKEGKLKKKKVISLGNRSFLCLLKPSNLRCSYACYFCCCFLDFRGECQLLNASLNSARLVTASLPIKEWGSNVCWYKCYSVTLSTKLQFLIFYRCALLRIHTFVSFTSISTNTLALKKNYLRLL